MPRTRPAMYNTPHIRTGGLGALQVEAMTNRPLSIARRHLAASQLRMRDIEPDQLSSSEWVRFLVMEERERERWMAEFNRRRRDSEGSSSSSDQEGIVVRNKRQEAEAEARRHAASGEQQSSSGVGATPAVSLWVRQFDGETRRSAAHHTTRRPRHGRRAAGDSIVEAPPTYESAVRARSPPPAYEPRSDDEGNTTASPRSPRYEP